MGFAIGSLLLTARVLGAEELGILTLMQSSFVLLGAFFLPKPWIAIVKFGAELFKDEKWHELKTLAKYSLWLEVGASVIAGIIGILAASFIVDFLEIGVAYHRYFILYLSVVFININGTPMGLLRLYDKVKWIRNVDLISSGLKLLLCSVGFFLGASFEYFFLAFILSDISRFISVMGYGAFLYLKELGKYQSVSFTKLKTETRGIGNFTLSIHFNDILFSLRTELDLIVIGLLLSPQAVGFYKVIKQFGRLFTFLGNPLKQAVYPDACHLWAREKYEEFRFLLSRLTLAITLIFFAVLAVIWIFAEPIIKAVLDKEFLPISTPMSIYLLFSAIFLGFQIPNAALLAMGKGNKVLLVELLMNSIYFLLIFILIPQFELFGAIYAYAVSVLVWVVFTLYLVNYFFRQKAYVVIKTEGHATEG